MGFNKKVLSKAVSELGKAKAPGKPKDIITDPAGQWKYPGQKTRIPGNDITMQGVPYPVWAQPNVGQGSMMQPNQDYNFPNASYVDETPMAKKGGSKLGTINLNPNPLSHYELNYGFNLPTEENGGEADYEDRDLTDEEIQAYRDGGYVVEELPEAQVGGPQNNAGPRNKVEPEAIPVGDPWSPDYDLRRFTAEDPMGFEAFSHGKGHATDQYKLPNHPTFSDHTNWADGSVSHGSLYSNTENPGGEWVQKQDGSWNFNTSHVNRSNMSDEDLKWYFDEAEPGNTLNNNPIKKQGGFVQHELVKAQTGKTVIHTDKTAYDKAFAAEKDIIAAYNVGNYLKSKGKPYTDLYHKMRQETDPIWDAYLYKANHTNQEREKYYNELTKPYQAELKKREKIYYDAAKKYSKDPFINELTIKGIKSVGYENVPNTSFGDMAYPIFKKSVIHNIYQPLIEEVTPLKPIPYQQSIRPEYEIIPAAPYVKPVRYSGPRFGTLAGDENLNLPEGYTQEQREAARRKRDSDASQQKNLKYQEQEKAKINSRLKPAGLTENFRQGGALHKAQTGEEFDESNYDYEYDHYLQDAAKRNAPNAEGKVSNYTYLPEVIVRPENIPDWLKYKMEFDKTHPYDQYLGQQHDKYKKRVNKKFAHALGINPDTLPEDREEEIKNDYEILRNNYITESLGKQKGYDPNKHREWVDHLSNKEREIASYSDYGQNLQPSLWARSGAGAQELGNFLIKSTGVPALFGNADKDVFNYKTPGLTNKEWNEIHNSGTGALETFSGLDAIGAAVANKLKNSRRKQPTFGSGQLMGNVSPGDAAGLNPFLLTGVGEMMAGKSLLGLGVDALKPGIKSLAQDVNQGAKYLGKGTKTAVNYGKDLAYASKEAKRLKLPTYEPVTRWDPDNIPYGLEKAGRDLTEEQQALTGSWYSYKPKGDTSYESTIGFYPTNRPGPGNVNHLRLSEREIANLENSMSESAKGMSGKSQSVTASSDFQKGELNLPQELRNRAKTIRFDVNPSEYIPQSFGITDPRSNVGMGTTGQHVADLVNAQYPKIMGIPRKYFPEIGYSNKYSNIKPKVNIFENAGSNLNAGISPQLIQNFIGPKNKVLGNIIDKGYISPFLSKAFNKYNPLNLLPVGEKLEGAVRPLGNVLGKSIKNNKLTGGKSLFGKAKPLSTQVGKTDASKIYAARFDDTVEGSNIRLGKANPQGRFSRKSNATFPIETKAGVNRYDVPISDPGVELFRKYPFMNKYAKINKQKLMNGKFQWSTTGAGLQNLAEKYGKDVVLGGLGYGAYDAYNYDKNDRNTYLKPSEIKILDDKNYILPESEKPSRAEMFKRGAKEAYESPLEYAKNPFFVNDIYQGLNSTPEEKNGGSIESWEDDLDDEEIRLLKEAGFIVEELK